MSDTTNTFYKGIDKNISKQKYNNQSYFHADNIQIVTSDNLSTGAVVTTKGTRLEFNIPSILQTQYENGSEEGTVTIPLQQNLEVIGGVGYDNFVILFTCNDSGYGQVWKVEYDESTGNPIGLVANSLVVSTHLIYNRFLNFRRTNRIKAFIRKEDSKFIRLYWNDMNLNPMRSLNLIGTPAQIIETRVRTIDLNPRINFQLPILKEFLVGDLPNGRIGYFYRLISKDGSITTFSPISNLLDLNNGNENGLYQFYPEDNIKFKNDKAANDAEQRRLEFSSDKAVRCIIPSIDKDYDYIQVGYVLYKIKNVPLLYLMPFDIIQSSDDSLTKKYEFIHSGEEEGIFPITVEEFNILNNTFDSFLDFTPKHNDLYIANIKNSQFDVDYDARAYRFNNSRQSYIYKGDGSQEFFIDGTNPIYPNTTTQATFDAINPYNDENPATNGNWDVTDQYKFQADGITIGGEGLNVKYSFITDEHKVDTDIINPSLFSSYLDVQDAAPFNKVPKGTSLPIDFGISTQTYTGLEKSFDDLKSPYKSSLYEGYARFEVYRFSLVFVSLQGKRSFVKWIGDIKMPSFMDTGFKLDRFDNASNTYYIRSCGIKFEINNIPQNILDNISGIEIRRVLRDDHNQSKLGTGITGGFVKNQTDPLTIDDLFSFVDDTIATLIRNIIGSSGFFSWVPGSDTVFNQISNSIADAITSGIKATLSTEGLFENISKGDFSTLFTNSIGKLGGGGGLFTGIVGIFTGHFGRQIGEWLHEKLGDLFNHKKVGGIDNIVYSLDNAIIPSGGTLPISNEGTIANKNYGYIISPINQFNKYKFRTDDYLVPIASYEYNNATGEYPKYVGVYHRDTNVGLFNRTHSTAKYKKWYKGLYLSSIHRLPIDLENTLDIGEILVPQQLLGLPEGTFVNAYFGRIERLNDAGTFIGGLEKLSVRTLVQGIGDKKHFIKTSVSFPNLIDSTNGIYKNYDQQSLSGVTNKDANNIWYGLVTITGNKWVGGIDFPSEPGLIKPVTLTRPNVVDSSGNFLVSYERYLSEQYGGATYTARSLNKYIPVTFIPKSAIGVSIIDGSGSVENIRCYGGDTYVGLYDSVNYSYYMEPVPGYDKAGQTKKASGELFPAEAPFNFNVREGQHFNVSASTDDLDHTERRIKRALRRAKRRAKRQGLDFQQVADIIIPKRFLYDEHEYEEIYHQNNNVQLSFPTPLINLFTDTNTNRIYKSEPKIDGELIDSWKQFKPTSHIDVEGIYGPITSIHVNSDRLYFYQNNAFGIATTNERESVQTGSGVMAIANSKPLSRYDYISVETGCFHTFGVVNTQAGLFHFDINKKKLFQFSNGLNPISDLEGLSGYFKTTLLNGDINLLDTTLDTLPIGIHGVYDSTNNRIYYTFLNNNGNYTLNYNLLSKCFESFHSFTPGLYIKTSNRLLSIDPLNKDICYQHNIGNYNSFYGVLYPSTISILINENPSSIKTFDNHLIFTEVTDNLGNNLVNETIDQIECSNDYQTSGVVNLLNNNTIRRKDRKWHLQIPRDINPSAYTILKSRLSDTYLLSKLIYNNLNDRRLVLHDVHTDFRESIT